MNDPEAVSADDTISIDLFAKVQLRVAQILSAEPLPSSKKLLKLSVDLAEASGPRQVLAGIAKFYSPDELVGRRVVIVDNLAPATLAGETSNGMLLAGASEDKSTLELVNPGEHLPLGARVM